MSEQKGLYNKYMVIKVVDDTIVENCFILKPDSDPAAVAAMQAYAAATGNKALAADLFAWVGKPMQKPLTLEELRALIDAGEDVAVYCEAKGGERAYANLLCGGCIIEPHGTRVRADHLDYGRYGIGWRAWATRPTDEERAAAPWEK